MPLPALREAARHIEQMRLAHSGQESRVLVCCALGLSRSAAAVAAWLVASRRATTAADALAAVQRIRPQVRVSIVQLDVIDAMRLVEPAHV